MSPPPPCSMDDELPLPILITTFVAIILSFMYLYEQEVEDHWQEQLNRIAAITSIAATYPTRCSLDEEEDDENHEDISNEAAGNKGVATECQRKKRRFISWDREQARDAILADYLGANHRFNERGFQRMFRISRNVIRAT